jgi:transposase
MSAYTEVKGYPPYHPAMMVALLLYAYRSGVYSSRRIARGCEERLDFQAVTALNRKRQPRASLLLSGSFCFCHLEVPR